ncbi:hypothetical protein [Pseudomonas aeruginosa]|uniref:hypothetical protein n=1 Tax=Pseudomonas aeruginosa TaxID=287 RepID=UPI00352916E2|nr:hypothetical protein [Pseudomonas aeruginosa]HBO7267359.1 hypothetical protein [Pseudomonas aeruginosa]HBO7359110.1 hypothetical protein [Pseudomonas aeruginosa]
MREEFEAWWNLPAQSELRKSCARGWAEVIWKASRAALRVELPTQQGTNRSEWLQTWNNGYNECHQRVKEALQQAGIEVK